MVTDVDLSRLPTGELSWRALITYLLESDDRAERYFLEVKSTVDLSAKKDQAKVAKFILGAANRDESRARRRFDGYALMVLGVGNGVVVGVPAFEAKDLAVTVQRLIGVDGPRWDFERLSFDGGDVIVVVVDPPTGELWTCRADGDGLTDGSIYVRADGETRRATGDEVRARIEQAKRQQHLVDVDVLVEGEVLAARVDEDLLVEWVREEAERLRGTAAAGTRSKSYGVSSLALGATDTRSREEFLAEVAVWEEAASTNPTTGVISLAGRFNDEGIRVRLANRTRTFLRDVRVDLLADGEVIATEWVENDTEDPVALFDPPIAWGKRSLTHLLSTGRYTAHTMPANSHGIVLIKEAKPASLVMNMSALRPEEMHVSDDDEVVLVMLSDAPPSSVSLRWRVTALDVNDVFEGTCEVPVRARDWRGAIRSLLYGEAPVDDEA